MKSNAKSATGFFAAVWRVVAQIPFGRVASYGQIASMLGNPRAARTVGWALHSLPEGTDVPWHRVINARGRISMDCGEHSPELQRLLLLQEGVMFDDKGYINLQLFQWRPEIDDSFPAAY
ncbi:MAG: methylated-DNA--[protein]-cysteine S-methyltransferase [Calditrichaeota bacterium]|nr:MAG: methylated-DNA--[protein]-cysteine S-methyltransferase [Calditrichota bacterium]